MWYVYVCADTRELRLEEDCCPYEPNDMCGGCVGCFLVQYGTDYGRVLWAGRDKGRAHAEYLLAMFLGPDPSRP